MSRRQGLSLVETTMALALLSLVFTGLFSTMAASQRSTVSAKEQQAASNEAGRQLDLVLSNPSFDAVVANPAYGFPVLVNTGRTDGLGQPVRDRLRRASSGYFDPGADDATMAGHVRIVRDPDHETPPSNDLIEVQVTVAWRSTEGGERRVDLVSRRAR